MITLKEKILLAGVALALVAGVWALCASLNKKMVSSCVSGGYSVEYCKHQVIYK